MILRLDHSTVTEAASGQNAWDAFAKTQQPAHHFAGCISQPAHAALSGRLAESLSAESFGPLPSEVTQAIGRHDSGWSESDLGALECIHEKPLQSFLAYPSAGAVRAWRKSVREAEAHSTLAAILTSRHFSLLAPQDNDFHHQNFLAEETARRLPQETDSHLFEDDLKRFTAALGFCDLLSLCLCSGLTGDLGIPLAHAADPASKHARKVKVSLEPNAIRFDLPVIPPGTVMYADGWLLHGPDAVASHRFQWTVG